MSPRRRSALRAFEGKVVLVSGASSGIGEELARQLGAVGASVGLLARREERLTAIADEIPSPTLVLPCDVTNDAAVARAVSRLADRFGAVDWVICNAGVSMNARFEDVDLAVLKKMMDVNYYGSVHLARAALPWLERSRGGVVFVSSVVGRRGLPTRSGYAAAKFAVHGLFESLRVEWRDKGIHVGLVAPGYTDTEIRRRALDAGGSMKGQDTTTGRVMSAADAAGAILFAAARRRREVILTRGGRAMVWLNKLAPRFADRLAAKVAG